MKRHDAESGGVLVASLLVGLLLAMLGAVAMNLALTETTASGWQMDEKIGRWVAESGIERVRAWLMRNELPSVGTSLPARCAGTADAADIEYRADRVDDDRILNGPDSRRTLAGSGRIARARLYAPSSPGGWCTVEVTATSQRGKASRTVATEFGLLGIPPLKAAVQAGFAGPLPYPRVLAHWGDLLLAGNVHLGRAGEFPSKTADAPVTGLGYGEDGNPPEDRWMEAWIGGTPQFDDFQAGMPSNIHANRDPVPGLPPDPWHYQFMKERAQRFGTYYVPDREGRLYRSGVMQPELALPPAAVVESRQVGDQRGLVFIDTLDQQPPDGTNLANLMLDSAYMEGTFYLAANVTLRPEGAGQSVPALSPSRNPVTINNVTILGVLHTAGTLRIDNPVRVFGAVVAERGVAGGGLLEVWYNADLGRGLFRGLPTVFPIPGTWREWSN